MPMSWRVGHPINMRITLGLNEFLNCQHREKQHKPGDSETHFLREKSSFLFPNIFSTEFSSQQVTLKTSDQKKIRCLQKHNFLHGFVAVYRGFLSSLLVLLGKFKLGLIKVFALHRNVF